MAVGQYSMSVQMHGLLLPIPVLNQHIQSLIVGKRECVGTDGDTSQSIMRSDMSATVLIPRYCSAHSTSQIFRMTQQYSDDLPASKGTPLNDLQANNLPKDLHCQRETGHQEDILQAERDVFPALRMPNEPIHGSSSYPQLAYSVPIH